MWHRLILRDPNSGASSGVFVSSEDLRATLVLRISPKRQDSPEGQSRNSSPSDRRILQFRCFSIAL